MCRCLGIRLRVSGSSHNYINGFTGSLVSYNNFGENQGMRYALRVCTGL